MTFETILEDEDVKRMTTIRHFKKHAHILSQGEVAAGLYVIKEGKCKIYTTIPGFKDPIRVRIRTEDDFIGETSFIIHEAMQYSALAETDLTMIFIPSEVLTGLSYINPAKAIDLITPILKLTYRRMRQMIDFLHESNIMLATQKNLATLKLKPLTQIKNVHQEPALAIANLRLLPFFQSIHHEKLDGMIRSFSFYRAQKNDLIFKAGDNLQAIYYVISGALQSFIVIKGRSYKLNIIGPGTGIGLMDFFDGQSRATSCIAREDAVFLKITHEDFKKMDDICHISALKFLFHVHRKVAITGQQFYMHYMQAEAIHRLQ